MWGNHSSTQVPDFYNTTSDGRSAAEVIDDEETARLFCAYYDITPQGNFEGNSILHVDNHAPCLVADHVHVGHHVNLHGCRVERGALIGIGAIVLSRARIGAGAVIGAGSVVLEGTKIPPRTLAVGAPARVVRRVSAKDLAYIRRGITEYLRLAKAYRRLNQNPRILS
ncbi:MAG: gamma carbonic anhydrase family protein [SAR324 cluster bacterium]|nr:gamma carbonic anhydrase family protein [SAR324 cluster bacterium]